MKGGSFVETDHVAERRLRGAVVKARHRSMMSAACEAGHVGVIRFE